ncbi:MAG TPA: DUF6265 family protein [Saprospiraceae bacterium]|nr:DUF6265 family protein [Saprospiraceae bacterium]
MTKLAAAFALLFCLSCNSKSEESARQDTQPEQENAMKAVSWLLGSWENRFPDGGIFESWEMQNASLYTGKSYFIKGADTLSSESIRLEEKSGDIFYIPTVSKQNDGKPVSFKLTSKSENQLVFENPEHDFPQKITYSLINSDSLLAVISGTLNGQTESENFPMKRVKK